MAFVFRSQQNKEKPIKTEDILHTNEKIEKEILENKWTKNNIINHNINSNVNFAFFSSSKKEPSYYYHEKNPGPGSYDPQLSKKSLDNLNEDISNDDTNKMFISKEERFKPNEYNNDLPGPGKYYKEYIFNQKQNLNPRKESGILYKKSQKFCINSAKRKITIPSKGNNFGYSIDNEGAIQLKQDPQIKNKFNGTYKDSVGPGHYSIENAYWKKNNALDWNKNMEKNFLLKKMSIENNSNKGIQTEPNNIKEYSNEELSPYLVSSLNSIIYHKDNNNNKDNNIKNERRIKNIITKRQKYPNISLKYSFDEINLNNQSKLQQKLFKRSYVKESNSPGPGKYQLLDEFDIIANNKQNQNFGSNQDRGLLSLNDKKKILKLELNKNNNEILINVLNPTEGNDVKTENNKTFKNNSVKLMPIRTKNDKIKHLISLKSDSIKNKFINNRNELNSKLGPGIYDPDIKKHNFSNDIQNFGSLSKRFIIYDNIDSNININNKGYKSLNTEEENNNEEKKIVHFKSQVPLNILRRNVKGISFSNLESNKDNILNENRKSPPVGYYSPEKKLSIEHDAKLLLKYNEKSPGFGDGEKRFYEKENNENENLGAGSYNILTPEKKFTQRKVPFIFSIEKNGRGSMLDNHLIKSNLAPGMYKYNDKNDWNKKSFNKLFS